MSILDTIDAALAGRCPCGAVLGPDSPSLDWCSAECQQRWLERQAHDPGEVYRRLDAHIALEVERAGVPMGDMVEAAEAVQAFLRCMTEAGQAIDRAVLGDDSDPRSGLLYFPPAFGTYEQAMRLEYRVMAAITASVVDPRTILTGITTM